MHNHLRFTLLYHVGAEDDLARIVGFEVEPFSVQHKYDGAWTDGQNAPALSTCNPGAMKYVSDKDGPQEIREPEDDKMGDEVIFTYDVAFKVCFVVLYRFVDTLWFVLNYTPPGFGCDVVSAVEHIPDGRR